MNNEKIEIDVELTEKMIEEYFSKMDFLKQKKLIICLLLILLYIILVLISSSSLHIIFMLFSVIIYVFLLGIIFINSFDTFFALACCDINIKK